MHLTIEELRASAFPPIVDVRMENGWVVVSFFGNFTLKMRNWKYNG